MAFANVAATAVHQAMVNTPTAAPDADLAKSRERVETITAKLADTDALSIQLIEEFMDFILAKRSRNL